jgi:hypothetical protein
MTGPSDVHQRRVRTRHHQISTTTAIAGFHRSGGCQRRSSCRPTFVCWTRFLCSGKVEGRCPRFVVTAGPPVPRGQGGALITRARSRVGERCPKRARGTSPWFRPRGVAHDGAWRRKCVGCRENRSGCPENRSGCRIRPVQRNPRPDPKLRALPVGSQELSPATLVAPMPPAPAPCHLPAARATACPAAWPAGVRWHGFPRSHGPHRAQG